MTDPRFTDPRNGDPRLTDPVLRRDGGVGGMWSWIASLTVLVLIAFIVVAAWNSNSNTASNNPAPITSGNMSMRNVTPPSTTGAGSTSPQPARPAPANRGTQ